jgi:5-methyltetrahydrofolate--homocysteine methyltransferase
MANALTNKGQSFLENLLQERILVLDGAMGTMVQTLGLDEQSVRGQRFADYHKPLRNLIDLLCITHPEAITDIHRKYLEAGADIIETNTFGSTSVALEDFGLQDLVREMNLAAVACARAAVDEFGERTADRPRFIAGSIGPTTKTASMSPRVEDPGYRAITFDQLVAAYYEQVAALMDGGVDILFPETTFDTLNLKACLFGDRPMFHRPGLSHPRHGLGDGHRCQRPHVVGADDRGVLEFDCAFRLAERRHQLCVGA